MPKRFTIGKEERLKSRKKIEQLFKERKGFSLGSFRLFYSLEENGSVPLQFGVGVSSKIFKKAVDRNRVKRLVREAYRLQKNVLQERVRTKNGQLSLFFIYKSKEIPLYRDVFAQMTLMLGKMERMVEAV